MCVCEPWTDHLSRVLPPASGLKETGINSSTMTLEGRTWNRYIDVFISSLLSL